MRTWLREIREFSGYSQWNLSKRVGVSQTCLSNIEGGHRRPSPELAKRLAVALDFDKHGLHWSRLLESEGEHEHHINDERTASV